MFGKIYQPVMFITATAGGTGLNLDMANHVILCEPGWKENLRQQMISRCWRLGQRKTTYVYDINSPQSAIDAMLIGIKEVKFDTSEDFMASNRVDDGDFPAIPNMPEEEMLRTLELIGEEPRSWTRTTSWRSNSGRCGQSPTVS